MSSQWTGAAFSKEGIREAELWWERACGGEGGMPDTFLGCDYRDVSQAGARDGLERTPRTRLGT